MSDKMEAGELKTGQVSSEEEGKKREMTERAEIDTSPPFESVKEAVTRFGGSGVWRPLTKYPTPEKCKTAEVTDIAKVEEQTSLLEKDLIVKERETLEVLKQLQATKRCVDELKSKLQKEEADSAKSPILDSDDRKSIPSQTDKPSNSSDGCVSPSIQCLGPASSPSLILLELEKAKVNLNKKTSDLSGIRGSVEALNKKLDKEKASMQKTRERLTLNSVRILALEEELNNTRFKLQLTKAVEGEKGDKSPEVSAKLQQLRSEAEQFKKMAEAAKLDVSKTMTEIEQTKLSLRTAEIRWFAAKKMEEAAKATEAAALAEIKAVTVTKNLVTLSSEEYFVLISKAQEAEQLSKKTIETAMAQVEEAEVSKMEILKKVEKASEEVKRSRKALEEAVRRVEVAKREKLAVEEALRKWRSEHGARRKSVHNSTKFKNPHPSHHRRDSRVIDLNEMEVPCNEPERVLKHTLSIGEILSRKLLNPDEFEIDALESSPSKASMSLAQMLSKRGVAYSPPAAEKEAKGNKQYSAKRKKFVFGRGITLLLAKRNKKKKP